MNNRQFRGLGTALITPFQENGSVDFAAFQRLLEHNLNNGVDHLIVMGTTGETATLNTEEKAGVLDFVKEVNNNRAKIIYGIGGNNTRAVVELIKNTDLKGVDGILSVSPYYNKPTQEGIYRHYKTMAENSDLPIILYNVPGRTGSNVTAETTLRLAEINNIVGVKEASGDLEQVMEIIKYRPDNFSVLSGDDALTLPILAAGGDGVISVVSNAFPKRFSTMVHAALEDNLKVAREKHYELLDIIQYLFIDGNPGGVKEVLKYMNICENHVRLPLVPVSEETSKKIYEVMAEANFVLSDH